MYCSNCGNQLNDKAVICTQCGCIANQEMYNAAFNAAAQNNNNGVSTANPQNNTYSQPVSQPKEDKPNPAFSIISFLFPIFGIVIFFAERKNTPMASKRYLLWSIISIILTVLFVVVYFAAIVYLVANGYIE